MTQSKKIKERHKLTLSDEDESTIVKKIKHNKKINLEFMIKVLHALEFINYLFTDLIENL